MDKGLSLITLHFPKVLRVTLEVSALQDFPIDFI